jgi:hypothetical protein
MILTTPATASEPYSVDCPPFKISILSISFDVRGDQTPLVVISESVFEHIPSSSIEKIMCNLRLYARNEQRDLLVLTRPTIFTGICGSHLTEWYHHNVYARIPKRSRPWEHLLNPRFEADTYLNRLSRAQYRDLFSSSGYTIVAESVEHPGLGVEYLADTSLRRELDQWPDEELLSNEVMFELVPLSTSLHA